MPAPPAVSGLQASQLVQLREVVGDELVVAVRRSADLPELRRFADTIAEIDSRLQARSASPDGLAENRSRVADTKRATTQGPSRRAN
jgi:hypothetical protein